MTLTLVGVILMVISAICGAFMGHPFSKSSGRKEGAAQAVQEHQVIQAQEAVKAVKERQNVEVQVAADTDTELDARLSKHNRAD